MANWEPKPTVDSMKKKKTDQIAGKGICDSASGYTTKAKPGPLNSPKVTIITQLLVLV